MKNKKIYIILILSFILISGCNTNQRSMVPESDYYSVMQSVFNYEYSTKLWQFNDSIDFALNAKTTSDLILLDGLIQGYTNNSGQVILILNSHNKATSSKELNKIVDPSIQESVVIVLLEMNNYLKKLNKNIVKKSDLEALKNKHEELTEIDNLLVHITNIEVKQPDNKQVQTYNNIAKRLKMLSDNLRM